MKIREKWRLTQNKGVSVKIRETWQVCHGNKTTPIKALLRRGRYKIKKLNSPTPAIAQTPKVTKMISPVDSLVGTFSGSKGEVVTDELIHH